MKKEGGFEDFDDLHREKGIRLATCVTGSPEHYARLWFFDGKGGKK